MLLAEVETARSDVVVDCFGTAIARAGFVRAARASSSSSSSRGDGGCEHFF